MNEKHAKFMENFQLRKPRLWFKFINKNRILYNSLCPPCQKIVLRSGGNIKLEDLCDVCARTASITLAEIKIIMEKAGGVVK